MNKNISPDLFSSVAKVFPPIPSPPKEKGLTRAHGVHQTPHSPVLIIQTSSSDSGGHLDKQKRED